MSASSKHRILVTNDDGIESEGLVTLAKALGELGHVTAIAPIQEMSASSHSISLYRPIRYDARGPDRYAVYGTPADAVLLGLNHILSERPHLLVSGINKGANLGTNFFYSGTVGAAVEGSLHGVPSIAISICARRDFQYGPAAAFAAQLAAVVLAEGLPAGVTLNVNMPNGWRSGVRLTRPGNRVSRSVVVEKTDPRDRQYYWIDERVDQEKVTPDSDYAAIRDDHVSISPLSWNCADLPTLRALDRWIKSLNPLPVV